MGSCLPLSDFCFIDNHFLFYPKTLAEVKYLTRLWTSSLQNLGSISQAHSGVRCLIVRFSKSLHHPRGFGWGRSVRNISIDLLTCVKVYISNHFCTWLIKLDVSTSEQISGTRWIRLGGALRCSPWCWIPPPPQKPQPLQSGGRVCMLLIQENLKAFSDFNIETLPSVGVHGNSGNICCYTCPFFSL